MTMMREAILRECEKRESRESSNCYNYFHRIARAALTLHTCLNYEYPSVILIFLFISSRTASNWTECSSFNMAQANLVYFR